MNSTTIQANEKERVNLNTSNRLFPVFLELEELSILLVGAGNSGLEKLLALLANSPVARVTIVAPSIKEEVRRLVWKHPSCTVLQKEFQDGDLLNKELVILATDNRYLHERIRLLAKAKGLLVNVADTPDLSDFYLGSIVQKGNLKIAISSNGNSPAVAKRIKEVLNETIPEELEYLLQNMQAIRNKMSGDFQIK